MGADTSVVKKSEWKAPTYGRQKVKAVEPTRVKAQDARASPIGLESGNFSSEEVKGYWTPTGAEPMKQWIVRGRPYSTSCYFGPILTPLPLSHFVTYLWTPKVLTHLEPHPQFLVVHAYIHMSLQRVCLCSWCFLLGRFCPGPSCQNTSVTT